MALSQTPVFLQTPKAIKFQITSTMVASTNPTAYTAGANGSKIESLLATVNASSAITFQIAVSTGGTPNYVLGLISASTSAGFTSTAASAINILGQLVGLPVDSDGNTFIQLAIGDLLVAIPGSSIASGNVNLYGVASDF